MTESYANTWDSASWAGRRNWLNIHCRTIANHVDNFGEIGDKMVELSRKRFGELPEDIQAEFNTSCRERGVILML